MANRPIICAIILTYNEAEHLHRCLLSLSRVTNLIYIVDSHSTDSTVSIASSFGCKISYRAFTYHADQFNWALNTLPWAVDWVLRLDADEILSNDLSLELTTSTKLLDRSLHGIVLRRRFVVSGHIIRYGYRPSSIVRLIRPFIRYQNTLMDEHFDIDISKCDLLTPLFYDFNLKPFSWWFDKHYIYAKKEALKCIFGDDISSTLTILDDKLLYHKPHLKHIRPKSLYYSLPPFLRALLFYLFRMIFLLGILNPPSSLRFIFFQTLVYRLMVDYWLAIYMHGIRSGSPISLLHDMRKYLAASSST